MKNKIELNILFTYANRLIYLMIVFIFFLNYLLFLEEIDINLDVKKTILKE